MTLLCLIGFAGQAEDIDFGFGIWDSSDFGFGIADFGFNAFKETTSAALRPWISEIQ